jgi:tRNA(Arg) A34 adenosine deaminase TadA
MAISEHDTNFLRMAIELAAQARANGDHPFGALLAGADGRVIAGARSSVTSQSDATGHAELNLARAASRRHATEVKAGATLYSSAEPCPMCAGAIVWAGIRRVVFAIGMEDLYALIDPPPGAPALRMESRAVFAAAPWPIDVVGPALVEEARIVHEGFWREPEG